MKTLWELGYTSDDIRVQGKSNEWYTPSVYIEAARAVMGGIDLDPASCEMANRTVKAARYYTQEQNGLAQEWRARSLWLNPPFGTTITPYDGTAWQGSSTARLFIKKLLEEYAQGHIEQAILLAKADPKQNWFHLLWDHLICFAYDTVYFTRPDGPPQRNQFGVCFVYLGPHEQKFIDTFQAFGTVARRVSPPRVTSLPPSLWEEPLAADDTERNTSHLINTENAKTLHQNRPKSRNEKKDVR